MKKLKKNIRRYTILSKILAINADSFLFSIINAVVPEIPVNTKPVAAAIPELIITISIIDWLNFAMINTRAV
ncbi:MAG TPA: hypothetical protein P5519_09305 [Spirochaetia bacterium]|nr:hypothetical protein [Spirochaetales bacterium]HRS66068.1 hypothetical protein [Spirochaetia bacterium]HOT59377.1 hypothetical protein [Spirochaetales bacterium]HPD81265.1 hypothetical protein [Spirochaetales bacterium]HQG40319.1 hypothetical protein [Spirochaetales bacterium]